LDGPGYDAATGILLAPRTSYPIVSLYPGPDDVAAAADALRAPFVDFPFAGPADVAAAVAAILAIVGRALIPGPVPLPAIRSPTPGRGRGPPPAAISVAATGRPPPLVTSPADDGEWRKTIMSLARDGAAVVTLDNVEGALGTAPLAAALTATEISDRPLGSTA